ncbi:MAG: hypothetical protein GYB33_00695 [Gammaproteobacteria bacterium]|uniref:hypothetical protein n=1 Tax=Pseudomaricurvus alcaniphilus TaxID=1166482 RepID=UPI00140835AA|nr:hypothetical protein [Pseudomaricurvus alcaniphilus]MBR9908849.1 hypothetical protein [Gammaproteobacteria bacterium]NHN37902.1 hypothetical protein [Pseudomaricurvus alcaniphilus]
MILRHQFNPGKLAISGVLTCCCNLFSVGALATGNSGEAVSFKFDVAAGAEYNSTLSVKELDQQLQEGDRAVITKTKLAARWQASDRLQVNGGYTFSTKTYDEYEQYDNNLHLLHSDISYRFDALTTGASYHFAQATLDGEDLLDLQQVTVYGSKLIDEVNFVRLSATGKETRFDNFYDRDADSLGAGIDLYRFFNQGRSYLMFGVARDSEDAQADLFDYHGRDYKLQASTTLSLLDKNSRLQLSWRWTERDYAGSDPSLGARRSDQRQVAELVWELPLTSIFSLDTRLEYGDYQSNLSSADYTASKASVAFKASF